VKKVLHALIFIAHQLDIIDAGSVASGMKGTAEQPFEPLGRLIQLSCDFEVPLVIGPKIKAGHPEKRQGDHSANYET
jgi:hypothetical protein